MNRSEWNRGSYDVQLKNGKIIKEYFMEFKTTDFEIVKYLEQIFAKLMDLTVDEILGEE